MKFDRVKYLGMVVAAGIYFLAAPMAQAGKYLDEFQVQDTCGSGYADNLASCTPFRCQKPSPLAMMAGLPPAGVLKKMPPKQQEKVKARMASMEKRLQAMAPDKRAAMKAKMISKFEIIGRNAQGLCQTSTKAIPGQRMDCLFDAPTLKNVSDYTRIADKAENIEMESTSHFANGKMVTEQTDVIDGKTMINPWQAAINNGQCKLFQKKAEGEWKLIDFAVHMGSSTEVMKSPNAGTTAKGNKAKGKKANSKTTNTLFILDASGSMWGQINGKPKIAIAKEVMAKLVPELPRNSRIGLIAYGHRHKGDCNDVEKLVTLGRNHQKAVLKAVKGLNALGKTPLTKSVNQAFKMLQSEKQTSTIILVSDGIESCNADPCATVKAARKYGVKFILHTVGFGLSKKESAQLQCMAKAGGGEYFQASNAEELLKSARKAVKSKGPGRLQLTLRANGKPVNAWVKLAGNSSIGLADLTNDEGVKPGHIWQLKPGVYHLETLPAGLHGVDPIKLDGIKIESGKTVAKTLDFDQFTLHIMATENGKQAVVRIRVKNIATNKTVFDTSTFSTFTMNGVKTPYDLKLLPGKYRLTVQIPKSYITPYSENIDFLSGGAIVQKTVAFESGTMRVTALVGGKAVTAGVNIRKAGGSKDIFATMPYVGDATPMNVKLDVGHYDLYVVPVGIEGVLQKVIKNIEIKPGGVADEALTFEPELKVPDHIKRSPLKTATTRADEIRPVAHDMEQNTDRPGGGDFKHIIPASDDPGLCQKACQDVAQCKAWTYVKPNTIQGSQPNCWLKTSVPPAVPNNCCVSGVHR